MKNFQFITFVLLVGTLVLSACGGVAATSTAAPEAAASPSVNAMPVSFVGIVDSIDGDQWVISGTKVTVDAAIVRDGPFQVGDQVKVEGRVNPDGSFSISRLEAPAPQDSLTPTPVVVDNTNDVNAKANTNDSNVNDDSSGGVNTNDDNTNASNSNDSNINDDNGGNSNDDNSNASNSNDDNGGNTNDDNSNSSNESGDDHGGNSNGDNSNDDHGGGNSNDDNGNGG